MFIPNRNLAGFAGDIVEQASVSLKDRIQRGALFRNIYLTGSEDGEPQIWPKTFAFIDNLSSFLYSPVELRFTIEHYGSPPPVERAMGRAATSELHKRMRRSSLDLQVEEGVTWALVKGKTFVKLLWGDNGFDSYLIQPESMGVLREDLPDLDRQEAFFHRTYYTPTRFAQLVKNHENRDEIMKKVGNYIRPSDGTESPQKDNSVKQIILGGLYPYKSSDSPQSSQLNRGVVDWLGGPSPTFDPKTLATLIPLDEVWAWDDERDDYTTIQCVGKDVLITGKDRHRNIFADDFTPEDKEKRKKSHDGNPLSGHHPFIELCPNKIDGYFWGRSEICNVALLQKSINERINGINGLLRRQENPPRAFLGGIDMNQTKLSKLNKPGGYLVDNNPQGKIQTLAPDLPESLFTSLHELAGMYDDMAGMTPALQGRGESGVRAQGHAETLVRTASPRFKDRALIVERQVESLGGLALDLLKAKVPEKVTAWLMPGEQTPVEKILAFFGIKGSDYDPHDIIDDPPVKGMKPVRFLLGQLPPNCKVVVDSHSSSPAFSHDIRSLLFDLYKAGAATPEYLVKHTNPPDEDTLVDDLHRKEISQAEFFEKHPEAAAKAASKKK